MVARLLTIAAVLASALANTSLLTWSSSRSAALDALPDNVNSRKFIDHILHNDELCNFDAVVLVQQPGVHASPSSHLARSISSAASIRSLEVSGSLDLPSAAESLSSRCNARFLKYAPGPSSSGDVSLEEGQKHVLCLQMPHLHKDSDTKEHDSALAAELTTIASIFPSHFVIYTGSAHPSLLNRQAPDTGSRPSIELTNSSHKPVAAPTKGSTFFTTGLISSLLIVFFILLPVLIIGVGALSSIQTPTRMDAPKGYSAAEKKNQ